jgi:phosphoglucosamine mutase
MGQRRWFGTDGIRGRVGKAPMTPEFVAALGAAAGKFFAKGKPGGKILVARDTRESGPELEAALAAGIESAGLTVLRVGVMPSGAAAMIVPAMGACAGAILSASHNPAEDNGLKFCRADGRKLEDSEEEQIEALLDLEHPPKGGAKAGGADFSCSLEALKAYQKKLEAGFGAGFSLKGLRVVVDAANGAAWKTAPEILRALGAEVETMADRPDGKNINEGCGSEHPEKLIAAVKGKKGWIGIAHDGDADRLVLVDEEGERVDGDEVIAMAALDALERGALPGKTVVATVMSNLGLDEAMAAKGGKVKRTPVGDRYVAAAMREGGFTVGGESSGHMLFTDVSPAGDGLLAALKILDLVKRKVQPLSQLRKGMKKYPQKLVSLKVRHKPAWESVPPLAAAVREMEKFLGKKGRILLRYSGTEPKVRLLVEADEEDKIRKVQDRLMPILNEYLGE